MPGANRVGVSYVEIVKRMKADLKNEANKLEGSFAADNIQAVGKEFEKTYQLIDYLNDQHYVSTAEGRFLDLKALEVGIERKKPTRSSGFVKFAGQDGVFVPQGFEVRSDTFSFVTTEAGTIQSGAVILTVESVEPGKAFNVPALAIKDFDSLPGLNSVSNEGPIINGTDIEDDESLRYRTLLRMRYPGTSGNVYHYLHWATEVDGVGRVKVFPLYDGPGTVKISILDDNQRVASQGLLDKVKNHIDGSGGPEGRALAPIGATLTVGTAEEIKINIAADVVFVEGGPVDVAGLADVYKAQVQEYFDEIAYGEWSRVTAAKMTDILYSVDGVYEITNLTINEKKGSIEIGQEEIATIGTVSLSEVGRP